MPSVPADAADLVMTFGAVLSSAAFAALAVAMFSLLLVRAGTPPPIVLACVAALAAGTPLFAYSSYLFSEPLTSGCLVAAALALFGGTEPISSARATISGALLGLAFLARPGHAIAAPVYAFALWRHDRRLGRALAAFGLAFGAAIVVSLAWNQHVYGDPLEFGYPDTDGSGKRLNGFDTPLWLGLAGFILSPGKSIVVFAPVLVLAVAGLPALHRRHRGLGTLASVLPLAYLFFYARFTQWEGGYSVGPRYLVPTLPLLCLGLAPYLESTRRRAPFVLLLLAGALMQTISMGTSFLEDQRAAGYYAPVLNYQLTYTPQISQSAILARNVRDVLTGAPPAPLGLGFDRWFVFLYKAGVAPGTLGVWLILDLALGAWCARALLSAARGTGTADRVSGAGAAYKKEGPT